MRVEIGKQKVSTRKRAIKENNNPGFFECFEFPVTMPGDAVLHLEVWDWNLIGDEFIGSSAIDIENRHFTPQWRALGCKPLESRVLTCPTSTAPQGMLEVIVELLNPMHGVEEALDIKPPEPTEFELRCVIWSCEDTPKQNENLR